MSDERGQGVPAGPTHHGASHHGPTYSYPQANVPPPAPPVPVNPPPPTVPSGPVGFSNWAPPSGMPSPQPAFDPRGSFQRPWRTATQAWGVAVLLALGVSVFF